MANNEFYVPVGGPGGNALLRVALIESGQPGLFRATFEEVGINDTHPALAASLAAAVQRLAQADRAFIISAATTPTQQPSAANSGAVFLSTKASGNQTYTLPSAVTPGLVFTFLTGSAAGEVLINPVGTDTLTIKATVDQGASIVTVTPLGIKNTAATNVVGDLITLISDGISNWWMIGQSGIWATQ
jgi:hypothetical protein